MYRRALKRKNGTLWAYFLYNYDIYITNNQIYN